MTERARRQAFVVASLTIAVAAMLLSLLGSPDGGRERTQATDRTHRVIIPPPGPPAAPVETHGSDRVDELGRAEPRELRKARSVAGRFAVAYLARDSARMTPAVRRELRATTTSGLWARLRQPVRATPAWRPPRASYGKVSGVSESSRDGTVEATIAYRRDGLKRFLSVVLTRRGEQWLARRVRP